LKVEAAVA